EDAVLADDRAAAEGSETDIIAPARAGVAVTASDRMRREIDAPSRGDGAAEEKGRARGRVDLVLVMHLEDLDVEIGIEGPRRLSHQDGQQIDAEAHIAGLDD